MDRLIFLSAHQKFMPVLMLSRNPGHKVIHSQRGHLVRTSTNTLPNLIPYSHSILEDSMLSFHEALEKQYCIGISGLITSANQIHRFKFNEGGTNTNITKMCKFRTLRLVVVAADPVDPTDLCLDPANPERVWLCRT